MKGYKGFVHNLEDEVVIHHENGPSDANDKEMDVVMLSLRTSRDLDLKSFRETFGSSLIISFLKTFKSYIESGHVILLDEKS